MFVHGIKKKSQIIIKILGWGHLHLLINRNPSHIAIQKVEEADSKESVQINSCLLAKTLTVSTFFPRNITSILIHNQ